MSQNNEEVQEISIEDLELSLEVYEIQSEQKLKRLHGLFLEKQTIDLTKMFYEERSSLEIKFQNIVSDLTEFLVNQEIASTDKLRKTFYRLLQNPLIFLFKVSRFQIFNLRLNAFDIELEPIDAISQLGLSILANIQKNISYSEKLASKYNGSEFKSFEEFLHEAQTKLIQDQIFLFYSYLRKGGNIIKKKFEDKIRVVEAYQKIQQKLLKQCIAGGDVKTLKELSILNYELYILENTYDVLCFYLKLPFRAEFIQSFKQLEILGAKAKQTSNYDLFILIFLRYSKEILAKIQHEGIDAVFSSYIENILVSLLELWGCRLCYYQQFYQLFKKLINFHPNKSAALELCLRHKPNLQKQDIVLLRTHFKHDLLQKHSQLLSLLKKKTMEEINESLSALYHQMLYNLDFVNYSREQILDLLSLLNGNISLAQFFNCVERAFKEWNHSIDFTHAHKYIQGQFKYPSIQQGKVLQSIRLFNNICVLQDKNIKDYQALLKANTIQKAFIGFAAFVFKNQQSSKLIQKNNLFKSCLINILQFLKRTNKNASEWTIICTVFSQKLQNLTQSYISQIITEVKIIVSTFSQSFTVHSIVDIYRNLLKLQKNHKFSSTQTLESINNLFMRGTKKQNEIIKCFRFFDTSINQATSLTSNEQVFLKKYGLLNGDIIQPKDNGCFVLSELQLVTNPVQFDKVMDNYYFTLDNNSKRYIQYLACNWINLINNNQKSNVKKTLQILKNLLQNYPISIPLLCSTRINMGDKASKRFVEILVDNISEKSFNILSLIISCRAIKYRNGRDYIKEEITPLILKQTIKLINEGSSKIEYYQLLALSINNSKASDIKLDLIQKSIETINFCISESKQQERVYRLSQANYIILQKYFQKKQIDMRKKGLQNLFKQLIWSDTRAKIYQIQSSDNLKVLKKNSISQQIMISPYAISQQFNIENLYLQASKDSNNAVQNKTISLSSLKSSLTVKKQIQGNFIHKNIENYKTIDLSSLKYNIQSHLGNEIRDFCFRQGFKIITTSNKDEVSLQNNEQNITLVQYYLKQFQNPEISSQIVFKYLYSLINEKIKYSSIFSNYANLQKLFFGLVLVLGFASKDIKHPKTEETIIDKMLTLIANDKVKAIKIILTILSQIGYTNLWAEGYNSIKNITYLKELITKSGFKQKSQQQSFLSWMLKITLQKSQFKNELNILLGRIFQTRPKDQNTLMYKVTIDRGLLNSIMKSLQIQNLSHVSLLFHSNFNNLRLYTDQLQQGLKALNIASKNRSFNEYIQLSKDIEDQQFFVPLKLFKENFSFFIRIQKEGYKFKKSQQEKLGRERVLKVLRNGGSNDGLIKEIEKVIEQFEEQLEKLQYNIASRVKSFYLATKLRDLSYQNSLTVSLLHQILTQRKLPSQQILAKIQQIQIFSLMTLLQNDLVRFSSEQYSNFLITDRSSVQKQVNICSSRRYSHSITKIYEKCQLQFDEVYQRCLDVLKIFFISNQGKQWLKSLNVYPAFLSKSFIDFTSSQILISNIRNTLNTEISNLNAVDITFIEGQSSSLIKSLRQLKKGQILSKNNVKINYNAKKLNLSQFLAIFKEYLIKSQTLSKTKEGYLLFNKYKTSQKTLQEIEILGIIIGYCVYHNIQVDLPLHSSLLALLNFGIADLDDLIDVDFKIWQDLRNVISINDSKELNLNFSYIFESVESLKPERVELIDKGTSKKVNNLNRQQYADYVCCYLLYKVVFKQLSRFLESLIYVCPKAIFSSLSIRQIHNLFIKKYPNYSNAILKRQMKKRGIVLPPTIYIKEKRYQNLKDYQSIQWLSELFEENSDLKNKFWPDESNLFVCTWMGQGVQVEATSHKILLGGQGSKQQLKQALLKCQ